LWVLAWIDALHYLLPDTLTLLLLWLGLLYHAFFMPERLVGAVVAAAFGYTLLFTVYAVYYGLTGKQGLGFGDMKLLAAIGAWLGVGAIANVLIFACALALLFALALRFKVSRILPFGPFLAVAAVLILLMRWDVGIWLTRWL
jgi:leader peptidase (prepilin peptidase) / N-methyltransferase